VFHSRPHHGIDGLTRVLVEGIHHNLLQLRRGTEEAADAVEPARGSSAPTDADRGPGWLAACRIRALVPRHDERQRQGPKIGRRLTVPQNLMLSKSPHLEPFRSRLVVRGYSAARFGPG
jgi:hypothetical protein